MDRAPQSSKDNAARTPAAEPDGGRAGGKALTDHSARGERLRELADLMHNGPAAIAQRRRLSQALGASVASPSRSAAGPVQLKTLRQAGLDGGLTETETRKPMVSQAGLDGRIYEALLDDIQPDKAAALKAGAAAAGEIGNRVDSWGRAQRFPGKWDAKIMFGQNAKKFENPDIKTLHPFIHEVTIPYRTEGWGDYLRMEWQHSRSFQGYITSLSDSSSPHPDGGGIMVNENRTHRSHYSNRHANTTDRKILGVTNAANHTGLDAYTKLAGEGARWLCVRNNMDRLTDDSRFYCSSEKEGQVLAVTFKKLWLNWASTFEKRYNIPDSDVANALRGDLGSRFAGADMGELDFPLEGTVEGKKEEKSEEKKAPPTEERKAPRKK